MAFAGKATQRDGWGYQAEHLALTHSALGMAALAVTRRRQASASASAHEAEKLDPANEEEPRLLRPVAPVSPAPPAPRVAEEQEPQEHLNARIRTLTSLSAAAKKKIDALESELGAAREELVRQGNENGSLQSSLEMIMSENARLLRDAGNNGGDAGDGEEPKLLRVKQAVEAAEAEIARMKAAVAAADAERDEAREQLAQAKAAATAAESERHALAAALDELSRRRSDESIALNNYCDALSSRAASAEKLLEKTRESFALHSSKNSALVAENARLCRCIAESDAAVEAACAQLDQMKSALAAATDERDRLAAAIAETNASRAEVDNLRGRLDAMSVRAAAAEKMLAEVRQSLLEKLELLQESLRAKVDQVKDLRQSHAKLIEDTRALLKSVDARDRALAEANNKIRLLTELVAEPGMAADRELRPCRTDLLLASTVTF